MESFLDWQWIIMLDGYQRSPSLTFFALLSSESSAEEYRFFFLPLSGLGWESSSFASPPLDLTFFFGLAVSSKAPRLAFEFILSRFLFSGFLFLFLRRSSRIFNRRATSSDMSSVPIDTGMMSLTSSLRPGTAPFVLFRFCAEPVAPSTFSASVSPSSLRERFFPLLVCSEETAGVVFEKKEGVDIVLGFCDFKDSDAPCELAIEAFIDLAWLLCALGLRGRSFV